MFTSRTRIIHTNTFLGVRNIWERAHTRLTLFPRTENYYLRWKTRTPQPEQIWGWPNKTWEKHYCFTDMAAIVCYACIIISFMANVDFSDTTITYLANLRLKRKIINISMFWDLNLNIDSYGQEYTFSFPRVIRK